jgi:hypothetical protein
VKSQVDKAVGVYFLLLAVVINLAISSWIISTDFRDNTRYRAVYENCLGQELTAAYECYNKNTGASEPVYFLVAIAGVHIGLTYPSFTFGLNIVFLGAIASIAMRTRSSLPLLFCGLLVLSDYYLYRMVAELHRLKIGLTFMMFAAFAPQIGRKYTWAIVAALSHFQTLAVSAGWLLYKSLTKISSGRIPRPTPLTIAGASAAVMATAALMIGFLDDIVRKLEWYIHRSDQLDWQLVALYGGYALYLSVRDPREATRYTLWGMPVVILGILVGGDRLNFLFYEYILIREFFRAIKPGGDGIAGIIVATLVSYHVYRLYDTVALVASNATNQ